MTIEEKVDGANLGVSFDSHGNLIAQNRGNVLEPEQKASLPRSGTGCPNASPASSML